MRSHSARILRDCRIGRNVISEENFLFDFFLSSRLRANTHRRIGKGVAVLVNLLHAC